MPNKKNLKPIRDSERARELQRKGVAKQAESRKRNSKVKAMLKEWAKRPVNKKNMELLKEYGLDSSDATNRSLVLMAIIGQMTQGDLKAVAMFLQLTGENEKYEQEIKKLKEENKKLKLEQEKLKFETGINKDIEDLDTLADLLKDDNNANEN